MSDAEKRTHEDILGPPDSERIVLARMLMRLIFEIAVMLTVIAVVWLSVR